MLAICPSMDAETTAETVREETIRSKVRFEGVNWLEATRHIAVNFTKFVTKKMKVYNIFPSRRYRRVQGRGCSAKTVGCSSSTSPSSAST